MIDQKLDFQIIGKPNIDNESEHLIYLLVKLKEGFAGVEADFILQDGNYYTQEEITENHYSVKIYFKQTSTPNYRYFNGIRNNASNPIFRVNKDKLSRTKVLIEVYLTDLDGIESKVVEKLVNHSNISFLRNRHHNIAVSKMTLSKSTRNFHLNTKDKSQATFGTPPKIIPIKTREPGAGNKFEVNRQSIGGNEIVTVTVFCVQDTTGKADKINNFFEDFPEADLDKLIFNLNVQIKADDGTTKTDTEDNITYDELDAENPHHS